jgi:hypothetical protein
METQKNSELQREKAASWATGSRVYGKIRLQPARILSALAMGPLVTDCSDGPSLKSVPFWSGPVSQATIAWLIQGQDDFYFADETTKLYFGDVSRAQYADDISSFYPMGAGSRAIPCIFEQLPRQTQR